LQEFLPQLPEGFGSLVLPVGLQGVKHGRQEYSRPQPVLCTISCI
jgi:hypothetical protein